MSAYPNSSLFDQYVNRGKSIVLAASGGGDSMALMDLYRLAHSQNPNLPRPYAVSVDHGLRSGFASEADLTEAYCARCDVPWQLVRWEGEKPKTGIMAAARIARYRLLADAARDVGAGIILTGHTLDDQNETLAMRASRGVASAMESDVLFERRAWISRPLLAVSRANLRAHLAESNINYADDPTNMDMRFERARVRKETIARQGTSEINFVPERPALGIDLATRAAAFIWHNTRRDGNCIVISRPNQRDQDAEVFALRYLAATSGGFDYPATFATGTRICSLLNGGNNGVAFTAQRSRFIRTSEGLRVTTDLRHVSRPWLEPRVQPFETFCGKSLLPLANALAKIVEALPFLSPEQAAI
jgi:tRNA(Ile)-lysidine synthase